MWPGEQHGGDQNPQNPKQPNPYQQPGYQQPNPYQQPGYGYPQQGVPPEQGVPPQPPPGQPQWGAATMPGGPQPQPPQQGGKKSRTTAIAVVTAVAVIAAAVVTGVVLLKDDDKDDKGDKKDTAQGGSPEPSGKPSPGGSGDAKPSPDAEKSKDPSDPVVPGWQTVVNPKHYSAFDVPENDDWELATDSTITGFTDDKTGDLLVAMSAPAYFKQDWCKDSSRAAVGTKGGQGSKGTKEAAEIAAKNWALAAFDQKQKGKLKESGAEPFSNDHGIKGHTATATLTGLSKDGKCDPGAAKVVTVSWINSNDDLAIWVLWTDAGVKDEVPDDTIKKMTNSLRNYGEPGQDSDPRG